MVYFSDIITRFPFVLWWAAVFAFVPIIIFLVTNPLRSVRAEKSREQRIYLVKEELNLNEEKQKRFKGSRTIYIVCLLFFVGVYLYNYFIRGSLTPRPFDIISSFGVIFCWIALIAYIPFMLFINFNNSMRYQDEGMYFRGMYIIYSVFVLIFCLFYVHGWLSSISVDVDIEDFAVSLFICVFSGICIAYMPVLVYVYLKSVRPMTVENTICPGVVFTIYLTCFLIFSSLYMSNWLARKREGIGRANVMYYWDFLFQPVRRR